jgi:hypothetical protein
MLNMSNKSISEIEDDWDKSLENLNKTMTEINENKTKTPLRSLRISLSKKFSLSK